MECAGCGVVAGPDNRHEWTRKGFRDAPRDWWATRFDGYFCPACKWRHMSTADRIWEKLAGLIERLRRAH